MSRIQCFLLEPTDRTERALRRYRLSSSGPPCPGPLGFHNAQTPYTQGSCVYDQDQKVYHWTSPDGDQPPPRNDPRWPAHCTCGYVFQAGDEYQMAHEVIYRRQDTGETYPLHDAPPGAMWFAPHYSRIGWVGPDNRSLVVRCPPAGAGNDWCVDAPSANEHKPWTRTGEPPRVTASPSILFTIRPYHGFLRDGWLEAC